jgi:hypothetical protein
MISISFRSTLAVRGMNLYALSSTHPSAALVMIRVVPLALDNSRRRAAYSSISPIFFAIVAGRGFDKG